MRENKEEWESLNWRDKYIMPPLQQYNFHSDLYLDCLLSFTGTISPASRVDEVEEEEDEKYTLDILANVVLF